MRSLGLRHFFGFFSLLMSLSIVSFAGTPDDPLEFTSMLTSFGITYKKTNDNIDIYMNENKLLQKIPEMQALGALNPEITQTQINLAPTMLTAISGLYFTTAIIPYIYKTTKVDQMHFKLYLITQNDYGNDETHLYVSFNFNRTLYAKINWDNFQISNLVKIAPHFKYSEWYFHKIKGESLL